MLVLWNSGDQDTVEKYLIPSSSLHHQCRQSLSQGTNSTLSRTHHKLQPQSFCSFQQRTTLFTASATLFQHEAVSALKETLEPWLVSKISSCFLTENRKSEVTKTSLKGQHTARKASPFPVQIGEIGRRPINACPSVGVTRDQRSRECPGTRH